MSPFSFLSFLLFTLSSLSLWIRRDPKIWGGLLVLSLLFAFAAGNIFPLGMIFLAILALLWFFYAQKPKIALFLSLIALTVCFKLHLVPRYQPIFITPRFKIGLDVAILGLLPLALLVPLSQSIRDWKKALQGLLLGCLGIGILVLLATALNVTQWNLKLPSHMWTRTWSNLILTSIPEEGFYRGFLQNGLCRYFKNTTWGKLGGLFLTSILFTFAHVFWSPSGAVLGFVFLASLLYGGVYLISGKIESAILTHFLLNLIHMTFFEYHAL